MSRPLQVGFIGCGTIGVRMMQAFEAVDGAKLYALADVNEERVNDVARDFGIPVTTTDYQSLLSDENVDSVVIATPNFLHAEQTIAALNAKKPVLVQKPFALTREEAGAMADASTRNNTLLMPCFFLRFMPSYMKLKAMIDDGLIGETLSFRTQFSHGGIYKSYIPASHWFYQSTKSGGGPLLDLGSHHLDALRWLTGSEIVEINTETGSLREQNESLEDNAFVTVRFANGVMAQLYLSFTTLSPPKFHLQSIEAYGTKGSVLAQPSSTVKPSLRAYFEDAAPEKGWTDLFVADANPFSGVEQHFVNCVLGKETPQLTPEDGVISVNTMLAGYESASRGTRIVLNEEQKASA